MHKSTTAKTQKQPQQVETQNPLFRACKCASKSGFLPNLERTILVNCGAGIYMPHKPQSRRSNSERVPFEYVAVSAQARHHRHDAQLLIGRNRNRRVAIAMVVSSWMWMCRLIQLLMVVYAAKQARGPGGLTLYIPMEISAPAGSGTSTMQVMVPSRGEHKIANPQTLFEVG